MLNQATQITVGASLLAKAVNDDAGILTARGALKSFASKLAPTGYSPAWIMHTTPCRSRLAGEGGLSDVLRRLVRWQASSYRDLRCLRYVRDATNPVGAGLPAKVVNDDACVLNAPGVLRFFASKLAPTYYLPASTVLREPFFIIPANTHSFTIYPQSHRLTKHNVALIVR